MKASDKIRILADLQVYEKALDVLSKRLVEDQARAQSLKENLAETRAYVEKATVTEYDQ